MLLGPLAHRLPPANHHFDIRLPVFCRRAALQVPSRDGAEDPACPRVPGFWVAPPDGRPLGRATGARCNSSPQVELRYPGPRVGVFSLAARCPVQRRLLGQNGMPEAHAIARSPTRPPQARWSPQATISCGWKTRDERCEPFPTSVAAHAMRPRRRVRCPDAARAQQTC